MEIKDRVAINDDYFLVQDIETGEIKDYVRLIRRPSEVIEEGTPINKELLQPLFDAHAGVDISNDYILEKSDSVDNYEASVYLHGNLIFGTISIFLNTNKQIGEILKINSKYIPLQETVICPAMANGLNEIMRTVPVFIGANNFILYDADIQDSLYVSFVYIKGE